MSASRALSFLLIMSFMVPAGTASTPPPASGDWTVTDETTIVDQTVTLSGNLIIKGGGVLTLENVTLIMNLTTDGQYAIRVASDGELRMNRSNITSSNLNLCYNFSIYGNASIENSTIEKVWGNDTIGYIGGVRIYSDNVTIVDTTVRSSDDDGCGLQVFNSSPIINECEIYDNSVGIVVWRGSNSKPMITNNHIYKCSFGMFNANESAAIIEHNTINGTDEVGIANIDSSEPTIINNSINWNGGCGIINYDSSEPTIINNYIINNTNHGIANTQSSTASIENNTINGNGWAGIMNYNFSESRIINNSIMNNKKHGIENNDFSNASIENNTISTNGMMGIMIVDSSKPSIINNHIVNNALDGIQNSDFSKATIINNEINGNGESGIANFRSSESTIFANSILNNSQEGIKNTESSKASIEDNQIGANRWDGILNADASQPTIINNSIMNNTEHGIHNMHSSKASIERNKINGNGEAGIISADSAEPTIIKNIIINNTEIGICNNDCSTACIEKNTMTGNGWGGIGNFDWSEPTIINNSIIKNKRHGIGNADFSKASIENNTISENGWDGIFNLDSSEPTIINNSIINNMERGISNDIFSKASIKRNLINENVWEGIGNYNWSEPTIIGNSILNNTRFGIENTDRSKASIDNNTINENKWDGVFCTAESSPVVVNNVIAGNILRGISAIENSKLRAVGNNIHNNNDYGIGCEDNSTAIVEDNKIIDNRFGAWFSSRTVSFSRNEISGGEWGIKILNCSPSLSDNSIGNANFGIELFHSDASMTNTTISSIAKYSVYCIESSSPHILNSTILAGSEGWAFSINGDSHPVTLNSVFDKKLVKVEDNSSLTVKWFMNLNAKDSTSRPLDHANILFEGKDTVRGVTDINGSAYWLPLEDRTIYKITETKASYRLSIEIDEDINVYENLVINKTEKRDFVFDFAPVVEEIPEQVVVEDNPYSLNLFSYISDRDHNPSELQISLALESAENQNVSLEAAILHFRYSLPTEQDIIQLKVSDGMRTTAFSVAVHVKSKNDPPAIRDIPPLQLYEDISYILNLSQYISDEEDALRLLTVIINSPYVQIDGFYITFCYPEGILNDSVEITVQDMNGATTTFPLQISITWVNDPPVITLMPEIRPVEDVELIINFSKVISDSDTPMGNISFATNSSYCRVDGLKLKFLYPEGVLRDNIRITVSDGQNSTSYDLLIVVKPVNDPPVLTSIPKINIIAGKSHTSDLWDLIYDPDTPKEKISIFTTSPYISVSGFNVTISYPADRQSGNEVISLRLSDGIDTTTVNLPVNITASKVTQIWITQYSLYIYILVPLAIIGTVAGIFVYRRVRYGWYEVKRAMIVNDDGRMVAHFGVSDEASDDMLVSSMLTAVQQFIEEAMKKDKAGSIKEFQYEDMKIAIERGQKLYLAVFLKGYAAEMLRRQMRDIVSGIEARYQKEIVEWDGRMTRTPFVDDALENLKTLAKK